MKRVKLTVAYDGTNYCGWQQQKNGTAVENVLNRALSELTGEQIEVIGASRTDSGVHALGNVAVFDTESGIPADKFSYAVNQKLPPDIRAVKSCECAPDWHPRRQEGSKIYEYKIFNERIQNPLQRLYAHHCHFPLSLGDMRAAAEYLIGEHDFTSFSNPDSQVLKNGGSAVREIYDITILVEHSRRSGRGLPEEQIETDAERFEETGAKPRGYYGMITIKISGSGFLYNMVRIIAGTLLEAGMGHYEPAHVREILEARDRKLAGPTAEAKGLCLMKLEYRDQGLAGGENVAGDE